MTDNQKEQIRTLRLQGLGYTTVANRLGVSKDTVKSYCQRNDLAGKRCDSDEGSACPQCGSPVVQTGKHKKRRFCTEECCKSWWAKHHTDIKNGAVHRYVCAACRKAFTAYGNAPRKYCSHRCYVSVRFKGGDPV